MRRHFAETEIEKFLGQNCSIKFSDLEISEASM